MVKVSAPGKCIIIGEHAVVYGKPAIIAAIGLRTNVSFEKSDSVTYRDKRWKHDDTWPLEEVYETTGKILSLWNSCADKKDFSELFRSIKSNRYENYKKTIIGIALKCLSINHGIIVDIDSEIPGGSGLGSSSSLSVSLVKGIAAAYDQLPSLEEINKIAYELEKIIHGTPSGGDNSACCFGGLVWFRKSQPTNEIRSLKEEIPYKLENFILVNTGHPEKTTGELIQQIRDLEETFRQTHIDDLERLTLEMLQVLKDKNYTRMKEIINEAQKNLAELTVSTHTIDNLCKAVRELGGAAKLCGAGGGGIVLCWHEDVNKLKNEIKLLGFEPLEVDLAVEGVRVD